MFTGIIEEVGMVGQCGAWMRVFAKTVLEDASVGCSIAVNGTCLTAVQIDPDGFWCDLSPETLSRTNLGDLKPGSLVNLERPLAAGARLSGHIVQGHVDGTAEFLSLEELPGRNWWWKVRVPPELDRYMIPKGSIALDGISLTIAALASGVLEIAVIPHTFENTALRDKAPGHRVNIEVNIIAKYVEKLVRPPG